MDPVVITDLTSTTFDDIVLKNTEKPVIVDLWAVWCVPCLMYAPTMEEVAKEMKDSAVFTKVNVDEQPDIAQRYNIMSIPTTLIFFKGNIVKQLIGIQTKEELTEAIKSVMPTS
mgnify:CR=1 FL=1